jgi:hypothetical protein
LPQYGLLRLQARKSDHRAPQRRFKATSRSAATITIQRDGIFNVGIA